jgi:GLPGLI family protein
MKTFTFLLLSVFLTTQSFASLDTSGVVNYTEIIKLDMHIEGLDSAQMVEMAKMIPTEHRVAKELLFNDKNSIYRNGDKTKNTGGPRQITEETDGAGNTMRIEMDEPEEFLYADLETGQTFHQRDFMGRIFLVESPKEKLKWKMTGNQKMILNYPCQEASTTIDSSQVTAWFTPMITNQTGPFGLDGLPGLILEATMQDGQVFIQADSVDLKVLEKNAIQKPKEGKKVSRDEFRKIVDEKTKEMQQQFGGNGNGIFISIDND